MSTDDRLIIRSPVVPGQYQLDLALQVYGPDIRTGIMSFIENFGQIYHGKMLRQVFTAKFVEEKKMMLADMWGLCDHPAAVENIDFKLQQIALAHTTQRWKFPVLLDVYHNRVSWINGHSRLLASGLCWQNAWDKVDFLLFVPHGQDASCAHSAFQKLTRIADDKQLRTLLGADMSNDEPWLINAGFETDGQRIRFQLRSIQDTPERAGPSESGKYFARWQSWLADHSVVDLAINVSVSEMTLIADSLGRWTVNYIGPPPDQLISFAQMSARILHQKQNNYDDNNAWHLYHFGNEQIDLSEFFFYVDLEHSVLHTHDWCTILVQPGGFFKCKEITMSST